MGERERERERERAREREGKGEREIEIEREAVMLIFTAGWLGVSAPPTKQPTRRKAALDTHAVHLA